MIRDARSFFDAYTVSSSSLHELVEVLRVTHLFSTQCLGKVMRIRALLMSAVPLNVVNVLVLVLYLVGPPACYYPVSSGPFSRACYGHALNSYFCSGLVFSEF